MTNFVYNFIRPVFVTLLEPGAISSYTCPVTRETVEITLPITCQDKGVYLLMCEKDTGECNKVFLTYVGEFGDGESRSFTQMVCATQADTVKPVGKHFRSAGHEPHTNMVMIPIEKVSDKKLFHRKLRKARESYYIKKLSSLKSCPINFPLVVNSS